MNGRERIALAMQHNTPDRVPVMCQLSLGHYNLQGGYKPHEIWYESEAFADATVKLAQRYRFDGALVGCVGRPPNYLDEHLASIRADEDGEWLTWRNGDRTFMPWDDMPQHYPAEENHQLDRADFETFDPDRDLRHLDGYLGHTWNVLYHMQEIPGKANKGLFTDCPIPEYSFRMFDIVKAAIGDTLSVHGSIYSPLTHYFELFGYETALTGFIMDPGKVHTTLDRLTEHIIVYAQALVRRGADAIDQSSAFVGAPFLSRQMYQEFVVPYERRVCQAVRDAGGVIYTHTCGKIGDRLDLMAATNTQGVDTLDPPPLGNVELAVAKRDFGDRLFFKGNMNSVAIWQFQTAEQVAEEVTSRIRIGKPGSGYILSTACSVAPHVEPWKIQMFAELADQLGQYN